MLVRVRASGVLAVVGRSERRGRLFSGCLLLILTHFSIVHRELWCGGFCLAYCMPVYSFS